MGRLIYLTGDLYSWYDQIQLALDSQDIITMQTPVGLVRMCTLLRGANNSVTHIMNVMDKVVRDGIPTLQIKCSLLDVTYIIT